jgi:hypothetical protein
MSCEHAVQFQVVLLASDDMQLFELLHWLLAATAHCTLV